MMISKMLEKEKVIKKEVYKLKKIFVIIGLLLASLILIACGDNVEEKPEVEYTITFNVDGGVAVRSQMRTVGLTLDDLPTPTKDDHEFKGWFLDAAKTIEATSITVVDKNMILYAKWELIETKPVIHTITFDVDGGVAINSQTREDGLTLGNLPTPTKDDHEFKGWFLDAAKTIEATSTTVVDKNMILYAKWELIETKPVIHTITFDVDGGVAINSQTREDGLTLGNLPTPTKDDHEFKGWFLDAAKTIEATSTTVVDKNMILYAKWELIETKPVIHTITFDVDGGVAINSQTREDGLTLGDLPTPTKSNFVFNGWYIDIERATKAQSSMQVLTDLTLYAQWIEEFTVTFNTQGGSELPPIKVLDGELLQKPSNPTKPDYSFVSWSTDINGSEGVSWPLEVTSNMTLYANWNETLPIKTYLSTLLNNYKADTQSLLPEKLQVGGKLYNDVDFNLDYTSFVNTTNIIDGGYGEQWQMVLDNLEQAQIFFNVLDVVDIVSTASITVFNNYLDNNPGSTAQHTFEEGIYTVSIDFRDGELIFLIAYTGNIPLLGEHTIQIALIYDVLTGERTGRIQLGNLGTLKYTLKEDHLIISSKYGFTALGVETIRTSYLEVKTEDDITNGNIFECLEVGGITTSSAAQFVINDTHATVIGNKASGIIGLVGTIVELYDIITGDLLAYEVNETRSLLNFDTLWFNISDVAGITSIKGIKKEAGANLNPHEIYVNGQASIFKTKNVSFINQSRRFDIEFRTQYFYQEREGKLQKIAVEVPMLFVQASQYANVVSDVKDENSYLTNFDISLSSEIRTKLEADYAKNLPIFNDNKDNMSSAMIIEFLGETIELS